MIARRAVLSFGVALGASAIASRAGAEEAASAAERARWIAGIEPLPGAAPGAEWRAFSALEGERWQAARARLSAIELWTARELRPLPGATSSLFYPFAGPDALHALAFFGVAPRMLLVGLEPAFALPEPDRVPPGWFDRLGRALADLHRLTFFRTQEMQGDLATLGVVPALAASVARMGGTVTDLRLLSGTRGARVSFTSAAGTSHRLDYLQADLANAGLAARPEVSAAIRAAAPHATLVKAAMYLLAEPRFSVLRQTILTESTIVLQDDTGVPLRYFDERWATRLFGQYEAPGEPYEDRKQADLLQAYAARAPKPLPFGVGYHVAPRRSNLLLASRGGG